MEPLSEVKHGGLAQILTCQNLRTDERCKSRQKVCAVPDGTGSLLLLPGIAVPGFQTLPLRGCSYFWVWFLITF